jgi:hypothetical protein
VSYTDEELMNMHGGAEEFANLGRLGPKKPWHTQIRMVRSAQEDLANRLAATEDSVINEWAKHLCEQVKDAPERYELHIKRFQDEVVYSFERKEKAHGV